MTRDETLAHLQDRGLENPSFYNASVDEGVVTFPLYEFGDRMVGYQDYRPFAPRNSANVREARYFTYLPKKVFGYFGLNTLDRAGPVYLVEGVFKAVKLHRLGLAAIALMGSETKQHMSQLSLMGRPYIGIGDNDPAGERFARKLNGFTSPIDLDEMTDEEVRRLVNGNN